MEKQEQTHSIKKKRRKKKCSELKNSSGSQYQSLFIRRASITARREKVIYLRTTFYKKIQNILNLYEDSGLSVFSYVDAVLEQHFETYKQDIKEIHDKLYTPPYEQ